MKRVAVVLAGAMVLVTTIVGTAFAQTTEAPAPTTMVEGGGGGAAFTGGDTSTAAIVAVALVAWGSSRCSWRGITPAPRPSPTPRLGLACMPSGVDPVRPRKEDQMSRTTGTSILVLGIVLSVVGAIMYWAVTAKADGFDINAAGLILFWVGVVTAVIGLVLTFMGNRSTTVRRGDALDGGRYEYEEEHRSI